MPKRDYLFCFLLLLFFSSVINAQSIIPEFYVNTTHIFPYTMEIVPNTMNTFGVNITCWMDSNRFMDGDIINMSVNICMNSACSKSMDNSFVFEKGCQKVYASQYFVPAGTNKLSIIVVMKRFDEPDMMYTIYGNSSFDVSLPLQQALPQQQQPMKLSQIKFFGWLTISIIAVILCVFGVILLAFRKVSGLLFFLGGICLFLFTVFF